jgi:hypothetical protein
LYCDNSAHAAAPYYEGIHGNDPELLSEAKRRDSNLNPGSGEELEKNVRELFRLERSLVAKLAENSEMRG